LRVRVRARFRDRVRVRVRVRVSQRLYWMCQKTSVVWMQGAWRFVDLDVNIHTYIHTGTHTYIKIDGVGGWCRRALTMTYPPNPEPSPSNLTFKFTFTLTLTPTLSPTGGL